MGGVRRRITVHSQYDLSKESFKYVQVLYLQGNVTIDNIDFEVKNGRYAIHQESGGAVDSPDYHATTILKNCNAIHLGNNDSEAGESAWSAICGQANGACHGLNFVYENVTWSPAFYIHCNANFDKKNTFVFNNCKLLNTDGKQSQGAWIDYYGSGHNPDIEMNGCDMIGMNVHINVNPINTLNDPCHDIRTYIPIVNGKENKPMAIPTIHYAKNVLCFETNENNHIVEVCGGSSINDIWGETLKKYDGQSDSHGFILGTEYIGSEAFLLGKRLGDCSSIKKNLIITIDKEQQEVIFDRDFTSYSNNDVAAFINEQIHGAKVVLSSKDNSFVMYPFEDCHENGINKSNKTIFYGSPVKKEGAGWRLCENGENPDGISCERINPNNNGSIAFLSKILVRSIRDYALFPSTKFVKAISGGYWQGTDNESEASLKVDDSGLWHYISK